MTAPANPEVAHADTFRPVPALSVPHRTGESTLESVLGWLGRCPGATLGSGHGDLLRDEIRRLRGIVYGSPDAIPPVDL